MTRFAAPIAEQIWDMKYRLKDADGTPVDGTVVPLAPPLADDGRVGGTNAADPLAPGGFGRHLQRRATGIILAASMFPGIALAGKHIKRQGMVNLEMGAQRLRLGGDQAFKGGSSPGNLRLLPW